jgi:tetratricopeptide (TPR) repeat protein
MNGAGSLLFGLEMSARFRLVRGERLSAAFEFPLLSVVCSIACGSRGFAHLNSKSNPQESDKGVRPHSRRTAYKSTMCEFRPIRKIVLIFVPIALLCCAFAESTDQFGQIAAALHNNEFEKALELLRPALQASPGSARLWTMQGFAYAGEGHRQEALTSFHSALKISPDYLPALKGAIQIEYESGSRAAIPLLQRVLRQQPSDSTSHAMAAVLEYQQGNCASAVGHFEKAGALFDSQLEALHAYATCLVRLKQPDKAATVFERALALNPNDRRERHLLASVQLMAHKPQDALATLGPLPQADAETLELASRAYEDLKDTPQAVSTLRQAILLDPQNVNLYLDFANLSYVHDSAQVGVNVVSDGIAMQPKAAPLYFARGVLYIQLAEYEKGQADFEKAYELDPSQSLSAAAQGLAAAQQNDLDRALAKIQTSLARKPNDAIMLYLQADILAQKGTDPGSPEFQKAMRSAKQAVALQPNLGAARGVLATLYLQAGQYKDAIEQCRGALRSDPKDRTAIYHLIQALRKTGNNAEIPDLLKQLALLRQQAAKETSQRNQYKLVEGDTP